MARIIRQTDDARSREAQAYKGASTLVKCLTEILLNSYESYQRLEKKGIKAKPTITIHADSREESVEVIDHFEGLAESEEKGIAILEKKSAIATITDLASNNEEASIHEEINEEENIDDFIAENKE